MSIPNLVEEIGKMNSTTPVYVKKKMLKNLKAHVAKRDEDFNDSLRELEFLREQYDDFLGIHGELEYTKAMLSQFELNHQKMSKQKSEMDENLKISTTKILNLDEEVNRQKTLAYHATSRVADLQEQLNKKENEVKQLKTSKHELRQNCFDLKSQFDELKKQKDESNETEITELKNCNTLLKSQLTETQRKYEEEISELKVSNSTFQSQLTETQKNHEEQLKVKNDEIAELKVLNSTFQSQLTEAQRKYEEEISELKASNSTIKSQLTETQKDHEEKLKVKNEEIANVKNCNSTLQSKFLKSHTTHKEELEMKKMEIMELKDSNATLELKLTNSQNQTDELEKVVVEFSSKLTQLKDTNTSLTSQLIEVQKSENELKGLSEIQLTLKEKENEELQNSISNLIEAQEKMKKEILVLEEKSKSLRQKNDEVNIVVSNQKKKIDELMNQKSQLDSKLSSVKVEKEILLSKSDQSLKLEKKISTLENQIKKSKNQKSTLEVQFSTIEAQKLEKEKQIEDLNKDNGEFKKLVDDLVNEKQILTAKSEVQNSQIKTLEDNVNKLNGQLSESKSLIEDLKSKHSNSMAKVVSFKGNENELKSQIIEAERQIGRFISCKNFHELLHKFNSKNAKLECEVEKMQKQIKALVKDKDDLLKNNDELIKRRDDLSKENDELKIQHGNQECLIDELMSQNTQLDATKTDLTERLKKIEEFDFEKKLFELEVKKQELDEHISLKDSEINKFKVQTDHLNGHVKKLEDQNAQLSKQIDKLKSNNCKSVDKINEMKSQIAGLESLLAINNKSFQEMNEKHKDATVTMTKQYENLQVTIKKLQSELKKKKTQIELYGMFVGNHEKTYLKLRKDGFLFKQRKAYHKAIQCFLKAIYLEKATTDNRIRISWLFYWIAHSFYLMKNYKQAVANSTESLRYWSQNSAPILCRAKSYVKLGKFDEAQKDCLLLKKKLTNNQAVEDLLLECGEK